MIIGFLRNTLQPTEFAKLTAMLCKFNGNDLIYLRPRDIDKKNNKVTGKMFIDNEWVTVEHSIPKVIDISPFCLKHKELVKYLRKHTYLTDDGNNRLTKETLQERLIDDGVFSDFIIPARHITEFNDVVDFLDEHKEIVVKPVYSQMGMGIYRIKKTEDSYIIGHKTENVTATLKELETMYNDKIKGKRHIAQKFIISRNKSDDPFDCRIHVEKNREGKWQIARIYVRIGIGQKVISNVNQGGGIADIVPFLKANYEGGWEEIHNKLNEFALSYPYKHEEIRGVKVMSLGVDIGIDKSGKLYMFEANSAPATSSLKAEVAMLRTGYYQYLIDSKLKGQ